MIDERHSMRQSQSSQRDQQNVSTSQAQEATLELQQGIRVIQPQFTLTGDALV